MKQTQTKIHYQSLATSKCKSKISLSTTKKPKTNKKPSSTLMSFTRGKKNEQRIVEVLCVFSPCEMKKVVVFRVLIEIISYRQC